VCDQYGQRAKSSKRRGRRRQAAVDAATIADIAVEASRPPASFHNYYDSDEAMVR
jgi:hypothetical protein